MVQNVSVLNPLPPFKKCKWNLCVPGGIIFTPNPSAFVINVSTNTGVRPVVVLVIVCVTAAVGNLSICL